MRYACTICGAPSSSRRCAVHGGSHTGYSPDRDRSAQARFREALMARAGGRCEEHDGVERCTATTDLRACHLVPLSEGGDYDIANGKLRCAPHDRATDSRAR